MTAAAVHASDNFFFPYQVVVTICGLLCNPFHSITPVKQPCLQQLQEQPNVTPEQVASCTGEPEIPRDG